MQHTLLDCDLLEGHTFMKSKTLVTLAALLALVILALFALQPPRMVQGQEGDLFGPGAGGADSSDTDAGGPDNAGRMSAPEGTSAEQELPLDTGGESDAAPAAEPAGAVPGTATATGAGTMVPVSPDAFAVPGVDLDLPGDAPQASSPEANGAVDDKSKASVVK
jgi:hypothetical protein